jgi:hypothetical protein
MGVPIRPSKDNIQSDEHSTETAMWTLNERVLARPEGDSIWQPGTIRHVDETRHYVILDSGDDGWFVDSQLRPLAPEWQAGDRVLARWRGDLLWYPGTILARRGRTYHVVFDDQDQAEIAPPDLTPLVIQVGETVLCRPKFERELCYYPAEVTRVVGEIIDVTYDDFDLEEKNTSVSRIRVRRGSGATVTWEEGERALVWGRDGYWYPAMILVVDEDRLFASLFDGRHLWLLPAETKPLRLEANQPIEARRDAKADYFPAVVLEVAADVIRVRYDSGDEETSLVRLVRVPEPDAENARG